MSRFEEMTNEDLLLESRIELDNIFGIIEDSIDMEISGYNVNYKDMNEIRKYMTNIENYLLEVQDRISKK